MHLWILLCVFQYHSVNSQVNRARCQLSAGSADSNAMRPAWSILQYMNALDRVFRTQQFVISGEDPVDSLSHLGGRRGVDILNFRLRRGASRTFSGSCARALVILLIISLLAL